MFSNFHTPSSRSDNRTDQIALDSPHILLQDDICNMVAIFISKIYIANKFTISDVFLCDYTINPVLSRQNKLLTHRNKNSTYYIYLVKPTITIKGPGVVYITELKHESK